MREPARAWPIHHGQGCRSFDKGWWGVHRAQRPACSARLAFRVRAHHPELGFGAPDLDEKSSILVI